jgi:TolA-binding protein
VRRRLAQTAVLTLSAFLVVRVPLAIAIEDSDRLWRVGTSAFDDKLYPTARRTLEEFVAKYPDDRRATQAWLLLGKARFAQQDLGAALDAFRRALAFKEPPGQPGEAKFWEAETLFRLKRPAEAEAAYDSALQIVLGKDPKLPFAADTMYGRAWAQLEQKRLEPAIKSFRELLETWPDSPLAPTATFALARTLIDLKRYEEALPLLSAFESKYPKSKQAPEAQYLLGWARLTAGQTPEGIQALRAFVLTHPTHELADTARRQLTEAVLRAGDRGDLEAGYRALMTESRPTPDGLYAAGQMAARLDRPQDQEAAWKRLREEFPDHPLAQRAALELAKSAHAAEHWGEAATLAAEAAKNDELKAEASLLLGEAELKLKDYPRALQAFRTVTTTVGERGLRFRALAGSAVAQEEQQQWGDALALYEEVAQGSPDASLQGWAREAVLALGKARLGAGDLERALDAFRRAERLQPPPGRSQEARYWEAETLVRLKRYGEARGAYEGVARGDPKSPLVPDAVYGLAWLELEQKRLDPAVREFRQFLESWPDHALAADATFALARTLVDAKRYDQAVPVLGTFLAKYPSHDRAGDAQYLLGLAEFGAGKTSDAIRDLRQFVASYPTHELVPVARRKVTEAVERLGDKGQLAAQYRVLMDDPAPAADDLYDAGVIAGELGRTEDQEAAWKRLRQEFPDHSLAQRTALDLARFAYKRGDYDEAISFAGAAMKTPEFSAEASLVVGESALKLKDYPRALQAFRTVTGTAGVERGLRFRALAGSAVAQEEQQQWGDALALYEEVAQGSPDASLQGWAREAVLALGKARLGAGDLERALDAFRRAERLQPPPGRSQEARYWEAETLVRLKRYGEARGAYEGVARADPKSPLVPDAVYGLAWLDLDQQRPEPAIREFRQFLESWPDHALAADATFALARTLVDLKRYDDAVALLQPFATQYPAHEHVADAQYLLGWAQLATGKPADGIRNLHAFLAASPRSEMAASARRRLSEAVERLGDKGELAAQYRTLMSDPAPGAEDLYDAGQIAGQLGRPEDEEAAWKRLRQSFPDHPLAQRAALELAHLAYTRGQYQEALSLASAETKIPEVQAEAFLVVGEAKLKLKDHAGALEAFKAVTGPGVDPGLRFRALAGSAVAQEEQHKLDAALTLYAEVAQGSPDALLQQWARDRVIAVKGQQRRLSEQAALDQAAASFKAKRYADASTQARPLVQSEDADLRAAALLLVGDAELKLKHVPAALEAFDAAAIVPGLDAAARYRALAGSGVAHEEQQQWPEALSRYQEVANQGADATLQQWARERVEAVRGQQERLARRVLELAEAAFKRKKYEEALGQARPVADSSTGSVRADALLLVGQARLKLNQFAAAVEAFEAAAVVPGIALPVQFRALAGSATAYEELRRWDEALVKYELIAASSPDLAQRKWARARATAVKARQTSPPKSSEKKPTTES